MYILYTYIQVTVHISGGRVRDICPYCGSWYDPDCPAAQLANGATRPRPASSVRPASSRTQGSGNSIGFKSVRLRQCFNSHVTCSSRYTNTKFKTLHLDLDKIQLVIRLIIKGTVHHLHNLVGLSRTYSAYKSIRC